MSRLDHPLKRISFVLFICSGSVLLASALWPAPFTVRSTDSWDDANASQSIDRQVDRIETACAAKLGGGHDSFSRDFIVLLTLAADDPALVSALWEIHGFRLGERTDLTLPERAQILARLSDSRAPCYQNTCVQTLTPATFYSILEKCSVAVGQHLNVHRSVVWRIDDNIKDHSTWFLAAAACSIVFLLTSILYTALLAPLVKWIRSGSA